MPQGNEFRPHIVKLPLADVISFVRHDARIANLGGSVAFLTRASIACGENELFAESHADIIL